MWTATTNSNISEEYSEEYFERYLLHFTVSFQICLNGKCVIEHENAIDYEGPGFLRRSGLADTGIDRDDFEGDTPAEPTHERYEKD